MQYTIKKSEVLKIAQARGLQATRYTAQHFKQYGENPGKCPQNSSDFARVQWVNGKVEDYAFPIGKLAKWTKLLSADELLVSFEPEKVRFIAGGSELTLCAFAEQVPSCIIGGKENYPRDFIGDPLRVVAPEHGGEFVLETVIKSGDLKELKKQVTANRKASKSQADFSKAKKAERVELGKLQQAAKDRVIDLQILAGGYESALVLAKSQRAALRQYRKALKNPEIIPDFCPATYQEKQSACVILLNEDGSPKLREYWAEDYAKAKGVAEYVGMPFVPESYWLESENIEVAATIDAHEEFARYVAGVQSARQAVLDYKPRKTSGVARYVSHRRGYVKPVLKQDKLQHELETAQNHMAGLIRATFRKECEKNGLDRDLASEYFSINRDYTKARRNVRAWQARKAAIVSRYMTARAERSGVESRNMAGGSIRARAADGSGKWGKAVLVSASTIESQLKKCADSGRAVEILASNNPAYPVGVIIAGGNAQ